MKIKFIAQVSGFRNGEAWPAPGTVTDWDDAEAESLIRAEIATVPEEETPAAPAADVKASK